MADNFFGYGLFNEVDEPKLRAWNRIQVLDNILLDLSEKHAKEYLNKFDDNDKAQMYLLLNYAKVHGKENTYKFVMRGVKCT